MDGTIYLAKPIQVIGNTCILVIASLGSAINENVGCPFGASVLDAFAQVVRLVA